MEESFILFNQNKCFQGSVENFYGLFRQATFPMKD